MSFILMAMVVDPITVKRSDEFWWMEQWLDEQTK
jgi:hypothetical protein